MVLKNKFFPLRKIEDYLKFAPWLDYVDFPLKIPDLHDLPFEQQIQFVNMILILYNLHLISEEIFFKEYLPVVDDYSEVLEKMREFLE